MARIRGHQQIDLSLPLYCKRGMAFGAQSFAVGDEFPWRKLGLDERKVRQLWTLRRIGHEKPGERFGAEHPVTGAPAQRPQAAQAPQARQQQQHRQQRR